MYEQRYEDRSLGFPILRLQRERWKNNPPPAVKPIPEEDPPAISSEKETK